MSGDVLEAAVICHLLDEHPATLTLADLLRELGNPLDSAAGDRMNIAVRELAQAGLVEVEGRRVLPSRPAIRYSELTSFMA